MGSEANIAIGVEKGDFARLGVGAGRSSLGLGFYDDFSRADTAAGALGAPRLGGAYTLTGTGIASGHVSSNAFVVDSNTTIYATQQLARPCNRIGGRFKFTAGNSGSAVAAIAFLISKAGGANLFDNVGMHVAISQAGVFIQDLTRTPAGSGPFVFTTVKSVTFDTPLVLDQEYTAEFIIDGSVIYYSVAGYSGKAVNKRIPFIGLGAYATFEIQYSDASGSVASKGNILAAWAGYAPVAATRLMDRCMAYYKLNRNTWRDVSGGAHTMSPVNTPVTGSLANGMTGASFTRASSQYMATAGDAAAGPTLRLTGQDFTISAWVQPTATAIAAGTAGIISKATNNTDHFEYQLILALGIPYAAASASGASPTLVAGNGNAALTAGSTYHLVMYYDVARQKLGIIVNNGAAAEVTVTSVFTADSFLAIGAQLFGGAYFDGLISNVAVFASPPGHGGVLNAAEINVLYNDGDGVSWPLGL